MSEESKGSSGAPEETSGLTDQENHQEQSASGKDKVSYDTYRKVLSEKKKMAEERAQLAAKLQEFEEAKLQAEGKKDEMIETYKKKLVDVESKYKRAVGAFAQKSIVEAFKTEALKAGCQDAYLEKLVRLTDIPAEAIDEDFNPNYELLRELVEGAKKENSIFFNVQKPAPRTGTPANKVEDGTDLSKLTLDQKARMLGELIVKQRGQF